MDKITIAGNNIIGKGMPVFIVAEVGVNHNGNTNLALRSIKAAKEAGADCVKFQTFKAEQVALNSAPKANYQLKTTSTSESQIDMLKKLELPTEAYKTILDECAKVGILFMSTPYSFDDVDFLETLNVTTYKIASGQIIELAFLEYVAKRNKPIFLSTGMATLSDVDLAVRTIRATGNNNIVLLQCTTNYPSRPDDANLLAIKTMEQSFNTLTGYSDHTQTDTACIASIALGVSTIEKHFTLDKTLPGPDHSTSYTPNEFSRLVSVIREVEAEMGSGLKEPSVIELENAKGMRRSIVSRTAIKAGETISLENITFKRPASGLHPSLTSQLLGKIARHDISPDHMFSWDDIQ